MNARKSFEPLKSTSLPLIALSADRWGRPLSVLVYFNYGGKRDFGKVGL